MKKCRLRICERFMMCSKVSKLRYPKTNIRNATSWKTSRHILHSLSLVSIIVLDAKAKSDIEQTCFLAILRFWQISIRKIWDKVILWWLIWKYHQDILVVFNWLTFHVSLKWKIWSEGGTSSPQKILSKKIWYHFDTIIISFCISAV